MKFRLPYHCVIIALLALVVARTFGQTFTPVSSIPLQIGRPDTIWPADFDGDGDFDVLGLNLTPNYEPTLFINGRGVNGQWFSKYPLPPLANRPEFRAVWRDANGDGLLDLLATRINDFGEFAARVYLQKPDHTFETSNIEVPGTPVLWADLDNDGRLDIVTYTDLDRYMGRIYWAEADGRFTADQPFQFYDIQAADLDRDGDLDLLLHLGSSHALRNDGKRHFTDLGSIGPSGRLIDLDGDGRLDLFANAWFNFSEPRYVAISQGDFQMTSNRVVFDPKPYVILNAGDFDGDGIPELLLGGIADPPIPALILTRTNGAYVQSPYVFKGTARFGQASLIDLDGDGDLDILYDRSLAEHAHC